MLFLKYFLMAVGFALFGSAAGVVGYDVWAALQLQRLLKRKTDAVGFGTDGLFRPIEASQPAGTPKPIRYSLAVKFIGASCAAFLLALSIFLVPDGHAGLLISQISGVRPGTLYPGVHFVMPLVDRIAIFDVHDNSYITKPVEDAKIPGEYLSVQAREGLSLGVGIAVRYHLDPARLAYIHENVPQPVEREVVAPVVGSILRDYASGYVVRDVFTAKREEFRERATDAITKRLAADGIVVKEVMLRDIELPEEYAKGLEGLLLKEQESEQLGFETDIKQKEVKIAELEAEAQKVRSIKQAEGAAQVRVLQAKAESDSMQYTLPRKQKQIEQARLEAAARKEETIQNAEAAAQSKVIDGKAEVERRKLLADASANDIRVMAAADSDKQKLMSDAQANQIRVTATANAERLNSEAAALKSNPMLIQKIIAERLSDKLQIIMVPTTGGNFFASDVLRSTFGMNGGADADGDPPHTAAAAAAKRGNGHQEP